MITKKDIKDLSDGVLTPQTKLLIIASDFALEGDTETTELTGLELEDIFFFQKIGLKVFSTIKDGNRTDIVSWK